MFTWPEIILFLLRITSAIVDQVNQDKWIKAGSDAEIAKAAAEILRKTQAGKAILEQVNALSDADLDAALRGLEPK